MLISNTLSNCSVSYISIEGHTLALDHCREEAARLRKSEEDRKISIADLVRLVGQLAFRLGTCELDQVQS